jgi:hypothetical protein
MNHFIGLNIKAPIAPALRQRKVGLTAINMIIAFPGPRPYGIDDADARIADALDKTSRSVVIIAVAHRYNEFVAYREDRGYGFLDWKVKLFRVTGE